MSENLPRKYLHVLLYIAWLGIGETHDDLEELFTVRLCFRHSERTKAFQVASDAILLFDSESHVDQLFEKIDGIYTGNEAFIFLLPVDATDTDAALLSCL
jgi:hypothetical protein